MVIEMDDVKPEHYLRWRYEILRAARDGMIAPGYEPGWMRLEERYDCQLVGWSVRTSDLAHLVDERMVALDCDGGYRLGPHGMQALIGYEDSTLVAERVAEPGDGTMLVVERFDGLMLRYLRDDASSSGEDRWYVADELSRRKSDWRIAGLPFARLLYGVRYAWVLDYAQAAFRTRPGLAWPDVEELPQEM